MRKEWFRALLQLLVKHNKWERESQETTRELLKVKDRLIEVERNVSILEGIKFLEVKDH